MEEEKPIVVLYYGDLDDKGLQIPESARVDIMNFVYFAMQAVYDLPVDNALHKRLNRLRNMFTFRRVGINQNQVSQYDIPENPERPGTYQWEGLDDDAAEELIGEANEYVDNVALSEIEDRELQITQQFRNHILTLDIAE